MFRSRQIWFNQTWSKFGKVFNIRDVVPPNSTNPNLSPYSSSFFFWETLILFLFGSMTWDKPWTGSPRHWCPFPCEACGQGEKLLLQLGSMWGFAVISTAPAAAKGTWSRKQSWQRLPCLIFSLMYVMDASHRGMSQWEYFLEAAPEDKLWYYSYLWSPWPPN